MNPLVRLANLRSQHLYPHKRRSFSLIKIQNLVRITNFLVTFFGFDRKIDRCTGEPDFETERERDNG